MSFEFKDGRFVSRVFYTDLRVPGTPTGNMMGFVYRDADEPADEWHWDYRFRYYEDDDLTCKSKDRKTWYACTAKGNVRHLLATIRQIFDVAGAGRYEEIIIDSAKVAEQMMHLRAQPWAHVGPAEEEDHGHRSK